MNSKINTPRKSLNITDSYSFNVEKNSIHDLKSTKDSRSPSSEETDFTYNLITRKTLRGRKEKITLPKNKLKCEICNQFTEFSEEDLISCSTCKCLFHQSCYEQYELYDNSTYKCKRCSYALKINKSMNECKCFICGTSNGVLSLNYSTNSFYHKLCICFLNEFKGLKEVDICKNKIRKWRYKNSCRYCGEKLSKSKAVIKCKNPKCKEYYHIPCAIEKGMIFDLNYMKKFYNVSNFDEIPFYCSNHNKKISFMYKTYVMNGSNDIKCRKNLFQNDLDLCENEEKKTFFENFDNLTEHKFMQYNPTLFGYDDEKIKSNYLRKNNSSLSIIEEQKENCEAQKDNENKVETENNMEIDDSFENNNNVFKLDFEKVLNKEKNENGQCLLDDTFCCDEKEHSLFLFNSNYHGCNNDNGLFGRQNSFNSLQFNISPLNRIYRKLPVYNNGKIESCLMI